MSEINKDKTSEGTAKDTIKKIWSGLTDVVSNLYAISKNIADLKEENIKLRNTVADFAKIIHYQSGQIDQMDKRLDHLDKQTLNQSLELRQQIVDQVRLQFLEQETLNQRKMKQG